MCSFRDDQQGNTAARVNTPANKEKSCMQTYAGVFYQVCIDVSPLLSGSVETLSLSVKTVLQ